MNISCIFGHCINFGKYGLEMGIPYFRCTMWYMETSEQLVGCNLVLFDSILWSGMGHTSCWILIWKIVFCSTDMPIGFEWDPSLSIPKCVKFIWTRNTSCWCLFCDYWRHILYNKTKKHETRWIGWPCENLKLKIKAFFFIWKNGLMPCRNKNHHIENGEEAPSIHKK